MEVVSSASKAARSAGHFNGRSIIIVGTRVQQFVRRLSGLRRPYIQWIVLVSGEQPRTDLQIGNVIAQQVLEHRNQLNQHALVDRLFYTGKNIPEKPLLEDCL